MADERPTGRIIKRYANRKLYDTEHSRYVTLDQISEMIRNGDDVKIVDNKTKEDLTTVTLAQIIYEEQKQKASSRNVPLQTLKDLIHQRTEKVLSDLREGPIGRLIPGGKSEPPKAPDAPASSSMQAAPKTEENGGASAVAAAPATTEAKHDWRSSSGEKHSSSSSTGTLRARATATMARPRVDIRVGSRYGVLRLSIRAIMATDTGR